MMLAVISLILSSGNSNSNTLVSNVRFTCAPPIMCLFALRFQATMWSLVILSSLNNMTFAPRYYTLNHILPGFFPLDVEKCLQETCYYLKPHGRSCHHPLITNSSCVSCNFFSVNPSGVSGLYINLWNDCPVGVRIFLIMSIETSKLSLR